MLNRWCSVGTALVLGASQAGAQGPYFTPPTPIIELNQAGSNSFSPTLTEDELYMVFATNRAGGMGGYDLWETQRPSVGSVWAAPVAIPQLNRTADDYEPNISYDGLELTYISTRAGGLGTCDLYSSVRPNPSSPWGPPQNAGPGVNIAGTCNDDPALTQDGLTMFFTSGGAGGADVWTATRPAIGAPWGNRQPFAPANSGSFDHSPTPLANGNLLIFSSNRAGGGVGSSDWWMVSFDDRTSTWSPAVTVPELSGAAWDSNGWVGGITGRFYASRFDGGGGVSQLYVCCWKRLKFWVRRCVAVVVRPYPAAPLPPKVWCITWIRKWFLQWRWVRYTWQPSNNIVIHLLAAGLLPQGIPIAGLDGELWLDPSVLLVLGVDVAPQGLVDVNDPFPNDAALVGLELPLQSIAIDLIRGTGNWSDPAAARISN